MFAGMKLERVYEVMSARLPDFQGHFPLSTTLVLRLLSLLYHTENGEYAVNAVNSMLSQTRLYLGGPSNQMAIKYHIQFSIEYLRRQNFLTPEGAPINFAGLIGHLHFTENAVFAFHTLLKEGYFYEVCRNIHRRQKDVLLELVLVLSHPFCKLPARNYRDKGVLQNVVNRSTSVVLLPKLPRGAEDILLEHNKKTLGIFKEYVSTYVSRYLGGARDDTLLFTGQKFGQHRDAECDVSSILGSQVATKMRSSFTALSGFTVQFDSIHDLCSTVRSGVFLEESATPYLPIYPKYTEGVPWNAYIYDFFKHGNMKALVSDNKIRGGDVWFPLGDFSLVLATITASLQSYFNQEPMADDAIMDVQGAGNDADDQSDEGEEAVSRKPMERETAVHGVPKPKKKPAKAVAAESWDDEAQDSSDGTSSSESSSGKEDARKPSGGIEDNDLMLVLTAFKKVQDEFDAKFKKVWV